MPGGCGWASTSVYVGLRGVSLSGGGMVRVRSQLAWPPSLRHLHFNSWSAGLSRPCGEGWLWDVLSPLHHGRTSVELPAGRFSLSFPARGKCQKGCAEVVSGAVSFLGAGGLAVACQRQRSTRRQMCT